MGVWFCDKSQMNNGNMSSNLEHALWDGGLRRRVPVSTNKLHNTARGDLVKALGVHNAIVRDELLNGDVFNGCIEGGIVEIRD